MVVYNKARVLNMKRNLYYGTSKIKLNCCMLLRVSCVRVETQSSI